MSKVDKKLADAFVKDFEQSLNVVSVVRVHDEVEVTFKRNDRKHIFPIMDGRSNNSMKNLYEKFIRNSEVD